MLWKTIAGDGDRAHGSRVVLRTAATGVSDPEPCRNRVVRPADSSSGFARNREWLARLCGWMQLSLYPSSALDMQTWKGVTAVYRYHQPPGKMKGIPPAISVYPISLLWPISIPFQSLSRFRVANDRKDASVGGRVSWEVGSSMSCCFMSCHWIGQHRSRRPRNPPLRHPPLRHRVPRLPPWSDSSSMSSRS